MVDLSPFPYLTDATLDAVIADIRAERGEMRWAKRQMDEAKYGLLTRLYLTAIAERTARLALTPEKRRELAAAGVMPK